ncbi:FadR/GntR family transcriptional regulator [Devosia sp.]|uniref:FadR/GntR family transcriptional regulator n=1 Tax=Devosia sp. TaxID=1871048 RepID=UPI003A957E80
MVDHSHRDEDLNGSAVENLVQQIRSLIDTRGLGVGDGLPSERELCDMFSSSRNTVREAMRMLKTYGVVDVRPKVGAVLIDRRMDTVFDLYSFGTIKLDRKSFLDTQGFRNLIEAGGFDTLVDRITSTDIEDLHALNDAMQAETEPERCALQDYRFHARLIAVLDNRQITEIYRIMMPVMLRIMENRVLHGKSWADNHSEHLGIIQALEASDRIAYQYRMSRHLQAGLGLVDAPDEEKSN